MRAVIQVVSSASVTVEERAVGEISGPGLLILLGVTVDDGPEQADALVQKIVNLRILGDEQSALELNTPVLVVSQFTSMWMYAKDGVRRTVPARSNGTTVYIRGTNCDQGLDVATAIVMMDVALVNSGPFI